MILRIFPTSTSVEEWLDAYPHLSREDIQATLAYAAQALALEETVAL